MKNPYLIVIVFIIFPLTIQAAEAVNEENVVKEKTLPEQITWDNKKFSIGMGVLSNIGLTYGFRGFYASNNILELNMRGLFLNNFTLSLFSSLNVGISSWTAPTSIPVLFNAGYYTKKRNMLWYVEGGGGLAFINSFVPVINIGSGVEWLVSKNHALGLKAKCGFRDFSEVSLDLSFIVNLVF